MGQVITTSQLNERIERFLEYSFRAWDTLPQDLVEFDQMDAAEKEDFILEWAIPQSMLGYLDEYSKKGLLSEAQQRRYEQLLELVEKRKGDTDRLRKLAKC